MTVVGARETVGSQVVQQNGIQCFNCKEFGHFAKECRKPKRVKDYTYHKQKMLLCKQAEQGVPLQAEQADWLADTDEEVDEQELEAHYSFMAKIQEVLPADFDNTVDPLEESELEKYIAFNDRTLDYDKLQSKLNETLGLLAQKDNDIKEGLKLKAYEILVVKHKHDELVKQSLLTKSQFEGLLKEKSKEETITLEKESRSKLDKDLVKPYDYTKQNSLYEIFKPPSKDYLDQLAHAKEVRKKMWRKSFVKTKPNIVKNIAFLPVSKSVSKSRQAYNEMHEDLKYVESLEKEIDELESDKADFSNMYDLLLQECVSKDVMCSYLHSLSDLDAYNELQCLYLHKVKKCEYLAEKLSIQTENVNEKVYNELSRSFAKLEKHSISLELELQNCKDKHKNDAVCKENTSNVFLKEREQYHEIQDLKAQLQDKNIAISKLMKLVEKCKGKSVQTQFDRPSVVRQPNAQWIPKPSVLGKPTPFSNSSAIRSLSQKESVDKTNVSDGSSIPVTTQILPQTASKAVRNTNVLKPGMYRIDTRTTQTRAPL
ncbi:retrovirus-related pol polyprotein from transposon TNT 1-94 [Tanacetum coccineum]